jgi:PKD repeat protein
MALKIQSLKNLIYAFLILLLGFGASDLNGQNIVYRDTFRNGVPATTAQIARWDAFRAKLLSNLSYTGMVIRGSYDQTGKKCTDPTITKDMANALRTYTTYISASTGGNVWSTCNRYLGEVWINPPSSCSGSNCPSPGYIIRPGIGTGNQNWGGINTATCGGPDQWMELVFEVVPPFNKDVSTVEIITPDVCVSSQDIKARFKNTGKQSIDSFQYTLKINSTVTGPFWKKAKLATGKDTVMVVSAAYSFTPSTNNTITVWTSKPDNKLDSFPKNDSAFVAFRYNGNKGTPNAIDTSVCGSQSVMLRAIPAAAGDSIAWFSDRALNVLIQLGPKYTTKYLASGATYKFYVASYNGFAKGALNTGYGFTNSWAGTMFNLTANAGDLLVDSLGINLYSNGAPPGQNTPLDIYMRQGGFNGVEQDATKWTKVWSGQVLSKGSQNRSTCYFSTSLKAGIVYGVYLNFTGGAQQIPLLKGTPQTFSNADLTLAGGTMNYANFGSIIQNGTFEGEVFYRKVLCKSAPDSAKLVINPTPYGAKLIPGTPFQTSPKKSGQGTSASPHVVALGDTLGFDLSAPTGYTNGAHNGTWKVANVSMFSKGGRALSSYTWVDPSGSGAGKLKYTPTTTEIDSMVMVKVRLQQIGGSNCDTFLTHYIYVAPLPKPDFKRASKVCDGDVIDFTNTSTIQSGFIEYKWFFGDGDSSEAIDPIKQYPSFGTYYCRLNAISSIYGYVRTKIDTIVVTQIPLVNFKVTNACETKAHVFTNTTTVSAGTLQYSWNFGDNTALSTVKSPTHSYSTPGQYKVTLTASANGCSASATKNAYLFPKPKASFTYPSGNKYCTNTPVTFNNTSTISSGNMGVKWKFEGGEFGTINKPEYTFSSPGTFTVTAYAISEFGCTDSAKNPITIFEAPVVSFTNSSLCDQTPTQFTNTSSVVAGSSPKWSFGDGNTSNASNPTHQYAKVGPTTVKLVVSTTAGCADSVSKVLNVGTQASVNFDAQSACSGQQVQFENKTTYQQGKIAYKWYFGGVDSSEISDPQFTFNVANTKTFNITLRATVDGGCVSELTKPLSILELPSCGFTVADDWTPGDGYRTVKVTANNTTYPYYRFKFSDGGSLLTSSGTYQFPYEGDFEITMVARNSVDCECLTTQSKSIRNSLGTNAIAGNEVRLYPNPSTGMVNIEATAGTKIQTVEVFNLLGEKMTVTVKTTENTGTMEMGDVSNGVYLVKVTTTSGTITRRVTINK